MPIPSRRELLRSISALGAGATVAQSLHAATAAAPASATGLRITGYEVIPTRMPMHERVREAWQKSFFQQDRLQTHYEPTIIRLKTDAGLTGIADSQMPAAQTEALLKRMVGHSPWEYLLNDSIRGVLVAIYDLVGQATELPVARLFAPSPKDRIVQTWWSQCFPPDLMASEAKLGASLGYKVHKVKARPWEDPIEQAEAISAVVPNDFRVWADANAWWGSVGRTQFFVERLADVRNYFAVESPIRRERTDGYRDLKGTLPLQLAEHMPPDPMDFVREGLVDAFVIGGPLGKTFVQRALMAEVTRIPLWIEHSIECGINQVFQAHQAAAFPGVEYAISVTHVLEDDLMAEPFAMKDGFYTVPTKPGLGVSIDETTLEKYRVA
jgi:L-alanine-DL-glutamate epimerase-like enolase superfamily enzyme